ncbi:collagenase-like [Spodoptera frugiperda]|uniref:Collagenase-like n=1 Tax=Spodoptera frugiperda TaxID=7108 RepID=A0A9R0EV45_SPOFR|nr:collagenase-like [Spodoptera frugiperda]
MQADGTINIESRIIGGERAPHPYPFFAGLIISLIGKPTMESFCGSSLLSSNRVVTAAHCYFDGDDRASKFEVVLGSNLLYQGGERHITRHVQVHPYYDPKFLTNDVAILYLPQNVRFTNLVHPIRLPNNYEQTNTFEGYTAVAVGFGYTNDLEEYTEITVLRHVELQVIDNAQCANYFGLILPNTICTSGIGVAGSVGICSGDSGGPLFVLDSNRHPVLIGITSFGAELCESGEPSGYSRVTSFMDFIKQHLY